MAKPPDKPRKPKDPAKATRAKAAREPLAPIAPALEKLLNPGIARGTAGVGSQTGLKPPPDNSFDRRADFAAAHKSRMSTPQGFSEAPQKGYVAREPFSPSEETGRRRDSRTSGFGPLVRPLSERADPGPLDPDLARQWGIDEEQPAPAAGGSDAPRPSEGQPTAPRKRTQDIGGPIAGIASQSALDALLREGRREFAEADKVWTPHRPPRPDKSEGGRPFVIRSEFEPKGDQPTAIAELVEGVRRHDRT